MKIELATIQDVPELQALQHKACVPQCTTLNVLDKDKREEALKLVKAVSSSAVIWLQL